MSWFFNSSNSVKTIQENIVFINLKKTDYVNFFCSMSSSVFFEPDFGRKNKQETFHLFASMKWKVVAEDGPTKTRSKNTFVADC